MRISLVAVAVVLLCAGSTFAQERGGRGNVDPEQMLERIFANDKDEDGKISKDEADERTLRMFDRADADEDGFLTKEEVTKMFESGRGAGRRGGQEGGAGQEGGRQAGGRGMGGPGGPGGGIGRFLAMMPIIIALDKDKNGELSAEEIDNAVAALKSLDKDKDGKLSTEEMSPDMSEMMGGGQGRGGQGRGEGGTTRPRRPPVDGGGDGGRN